MNLSSFFNSQLANYSVHYLVIMLFFHNLKNVKQHSTFQFAEPCFTFQWNFKFLNAISSFTLSKERSNKSCTRRNKGMCNFTGIKFLN